MGSAIVDPALPEAFRRDGVVCVRGAFFPGLADELPAGAPMEHPLFPILWERARSDP